MEYLSNKVVLKIDYFFEALTNDTTSLSRN